MLNCSLVVSYWKSKSALPVLIKKRTSTSIPINKNVITKNDPECEKKKFI